MAGRTVAGSGGQAAWSSPPGAPSVASLIDMTRGIGVLWILGAGAIACGDDSPPQACTTDCSTGGPSSTGLTAASGPSSAGITSDATDTSEVTETGAGPTSSPTGADDTSSESTDTGPGPDPAAFRCGDPRRPMARPTFADPVDLQGSDGTGGSAAGDLDGDGRDEFVAQILFKIYDWEDGEWTVHQPLPNLQGRGNRFAGDLELADIDQDGQLDIVVPDSDNNGSQGALSWFRNPGALDGPWEEQVVTTFDGNGDDDSVAHLSELEVGDIDADGWPDLVVRDISHGVWVLLQLPGGGGWHPRRFIPVLPREGLELWDPDEDGRLDILLNGVWLETPEDAVTGDYVVHPIGGMEPWYAPDLSTSSVRDYASKVEAADFNGDRRIDVAITNSEELQSNSPGKPSGISVFLQPGDLVADPWTEVTVTLEHWSWHTLMIADFDFDGSADLLTAVSAVGTDDASDDIHLWLNDGAGTGFAGQSLSMDHTVYQGIIGDYDGDGDCDLVAPDHFNSGPVRLFENTTAGG